MLVVAVLELAMFGIAFGDVVVAVCARGGVRG